MALLFEVSFSGADVYRSVLGVCEPGAARGADGRYFRVFASVSVLCDLKCTKVTNRRVHAHPQLARAAPAVMLTGHTYAVK